MFVVAVGNVPLAAVADWSNIRRTLGVNGTRIWALAGDSVLGFIEVDTNLGEANRAAGIASWADIGNLQVAEAHRRQGIGSWLIAEAAGWLELAGISRLLDYASPDDTACVEFLERVGFREPTRTIRGPGDALASRRRGRFPLPAVALDDIDWWQEHLWPALDMQLGETPVQPFWQPPARSPFPSGA